MNLSRIYIILIIAFLCASCIDNKPEITGNGKKEKVRVILDWKPGPESAFMFYGIDKGIFDSLGIEIDWKPSNGSSVVSTSLASNEADVGFISSDYLLVSRSKEFPIKAVMVLYHETPVVIYSLKEKNITKPEDLKGKNLGVLVKSSAYPQVISFLKINGVKPGSYKEVFTKGSTDDLISGKTDASMHYTNYSPITLQARHGLEVNEIRLSNYGIKMYGTAIAMTERLLQKDPDLAERVVFGFLKSLEMAMDDHEGVLESLLKYDPSHNRAEMDFALKRTEEMIYTTTSELLGVGYMTRAGWLETLNQMNRLNPEEIQIQNIEQVFTSRFLDNYQLKK